MESHAGMRCSEGANVGKLWAVAMSNLQKHILTDAGLQQYRICRVGLNSKLMDMGRYSSG